MTSIEPHTFHSKGPALSTVLAASPTWERTLVPIEPAARAALASVAGLLALVAIGQHFAVRLIPVAETPPFFLVGWPWTETVILQVASFAPLYIAAASTLAVLGGITQGFAMAGRRLQIALGFLAGVGALALLPPLGLLVIAVANLVVWIVFIALAIAAGVALLWGLLAAALDA